MCENKVEILRKNKKIENSKKNKKSKNKRKELHKKISCNKKGIVIFLGQLYYIVFFSFLLSCLEFGNNF